MSMMRKSLAILAVSAAWALPAHAQMARAQDPESVANAMRTGGYTATIGVDKVGDPMITSSTAGTAYQLFFYNCTEHKECATVQFHVGFDLSTAPALESINAWNRSQRFGRAYLDKEGDPILEMDVDLDDGGVTPLLFVDNVEFWTSALEKFQKHIGYSK